MKLKHIIQIIILVPMLLFGKEKPYTNNHALGKLGDFPEPGNPQLDRAMGLIIKGKIKSSIMNYGNFIDIDHDRNGSWDNYPVGLWGKYAYLPTVAFMSGVPGSYYSYKFEEEWTEVYDLPGDLDVVVFANEEAYDYWFEGSFVEVSSGKCPSDDFSKVRFAGVIFENNNDADGIVGTLVNEDFNDCGVDGLCSAEYDADGNVISDYSGPDEGEGDCEYQDFEEIFGDNGDNKLTFGDDMYTLFTGPNEYAIDHEKKRILISVDNRVNPNLGNAYKGIDLNLDNKKSIGFIYPWALRPALESREITKSYDNYDYTGCEGDWSDCLNLDYYGSSVSESWFDSYNDIDWQPTPQARQNTHNTNVNIGDVFGDLPYVEDDDEFAVLAHSNNADTWPTRIDLQTGDEIPFWPGWYADKYDPDLFECGGNKASPRCWKPDSTRFVSDSDVYMEFDDRWAHIGNNVNSSGEKYKTKGYPLGFNVKATAHSYGVSFAEDIMFVTLKVRNESGDYCAFTKISDPDNPGLLNKVPVLDENGNQVCGEGMVLPDGSKINEGKGYDYEGVSLGFYFDADAATQDITGNNAVHSNADDFMEYLDTLVVVNDENLIISMAMIYDLDGVSSGQTGLGIVGVQLLDSPISTGYLTEEENGIVRIPGQKLKMTDWHWFDWFTRPGVRSSSGGTADDKEAIQYKIMVGDTTNLTNGQKAAHFHTANPATDEVTNVHFDSLEGLPLEEAFSGGLDCVLIMSCGPFDLEVGEEVPFSFTVIFGENQRDLRENATFAQVMYNSHYQGFTAPDLPTIEPETDDGQVALYWDSSPESSTDVVTEYSDFAGYRIYKSKDRGLTWGDPINRIYDNSGIHVGWRPIAQFDLPAEKDISFCLKGANADGTCKTSSDCPGDCIRNMEISGPDPLAPWINLGDNQWFDGENDELYGVHYNNLNDFLYYYIDRGTCKDYRYPDSTICVENGSIWEKIDNGVEYTYTITAYDMGIPADYTLNWNFIDSVYTDSSAYALFGSDTVYNDSNPDNWSSPYGYQSIESPLGTTVQDVNFTTIRAGHNTSSGAHIVSPTVVPNPYYVHSNFNENEWVRKIHFTRLPKGETTIKIFTISGERVNTLSSTGDLACTGCENYDGVIEWNLRSMNNQEIAPGLYIYVVESSGYEHIGKFAVVR
jgi:hypothetical protein